MARSCGHGTIKYQELKIRVGWLIEIKSMAYDKKKIYKQAIEAIKDNTIYFIEDVVAFLPISKSTFYDYFPIDSNELNDIRELLEQNKI